MTITEIILGMLFVAVSTTILVGGPKNLHKSAAELSVADFERNKTRAAAVLCPLVGLIIIGSVFYRWQTSDSVEEPVFFYLGLGAAGIFYGLYRWIRLSSGK